MNDTMIISPIVARALEHQRQQLDSACDPAYIAERLLAASPHALTADEAHALVGDFKRRCQDLGALGQVCSEYGITEWVAARPDYWAEWA